MKGSFSLAYRTYRHIKFAQKLQIDIQRNLFSQTGLHNKSKMNRVGITLIATTIEGQSTASPASVQQLAVGPIVTTPTSNKENNKISQNLSQKRTMEQFNKNTSQATEILKASHVVCFDVDSTVIKEEGIDELAKFCGKGDEVKELTKEAMGGAMSFEEALTRRLNIIRPTQAQIKEFTKLHPSTITPGLRDLINKLKQEGKQIFLISGGFDCLINEVAIEIGVPVENVYANKLYFTYDGQYAGFDLTQPTSHSGGKAEAINLVRRRTEAPHERKIVTMIGDGATDMEAVPPADYFIGFGGNVVREAVFRGAQYYTVDFKNVLW
ncbi:phosphoserine phosphatase [Culicoides brevitarsis]|uniref:phosphoserine phosphatase n=1 Tax=Culicoides brevitarsis TaxID=469753 RepID=UPI00307BDC23